MGAFDKIKNNGNSTGMFSQNSAKFMFSTNTTGKAKSLPFENVQLNRMFLQAHHNYKNSGDTDPVNSAYNDVLNYINNWHESKKLGARDPVGAAANMFNKKSQTAQWQAKTKDMGYDDLKALWDEAGYKTAADWARDNQRRAQDAASAWKTAQKNNEIAQDMTADAARQDKFAARAGVDQKKLTQEREAEKKQMEEEDLQKRFWENLPGYAESVMRGNITALADQPEYIQDKYIDTVNTDAWRDIIGDAYSWDQLTETQKQGINAFAAAGGAPKTAEEADAEREAEWKAAAAEQQATMDAWLKANPAIAKVSADPAQAQQYIDFYDNIDVYMQRIMDGEIDELPEGVQDAFQEFATTPEFAQYENTILYGNREQGMSDAQLANITSYGKRKADQYRAGMAIYQPYKQDDYQQYLWQEMINTPEGAQAWVDNSKGFSDLQKAEDNLWFVTQREKYAGLEENPDYAEKSKTKEVKIGLISSADDQKYAYITNQSGYREQIEEAAAMGGRASNYWLYQYMDEDEVAKYKYLHEAEGQRAADEYLTYLEYDLNRRAYEDQIKRAYDVTQTGWIPALAMNAGSLATQQLRGTQMLDVAWQKIFSGDRPVDYYRGAGLGGFTDAVRQSTADKYNWNIKIGDVEFDLFDKLYQTASSSLDSVISGTISAVLSGGNPKVAIAINNLLVGSQSAQQALMAARERGASDAQALGEAVAFGVAEGLFETWSFGKLWDSATALQKGTKSGIIKDVLAQMGINASEEFFTEASNILSDYLIMGDKSQAMLDYERYKMLGLEGDELKAAMVKNIASQLYEAGEGGALQGLLMGAGADTQSYYNTSRVDKNIGENVVKNGTRDAILERASTFDANSWAAKAAQKYKQKSTPQNLGQVYRATLTEMNENGIRDQLGRHEETPEMVSRVYQDVMDRLTAKGEKENVENVATAVTLLYAGAELTQEEMQAVSASEFGLQTAEEILGYREQHDVMADQGRQEATAEDAEQEAGAADVMPDQEMQEADQMQNPAQITTAAGEMKTVTEVRSSEDGEPVIKTDDGDEINVDDAPLTDAQKTLAYAAQGTEYAPQTMAAYTEAESQQTKAEDFARGFKRIAQEAAKGATLQEATRGIYARKLSQEAQQKAYAAGQEARAQRFQAENSATYKAAQRDGYQQYTNETGSKAGVYYGKVTRETTDEEKTMLGLLNRFANDYGMQIRVYDDIKGKNGVYYANTNAIAVSLNADAGAITRVVSHEGYHYIREWNREAADKLGEMVLHALQEKDGYDLDTRIREKMAEYQRAGVTLSEENAREEIIADALLDYIGTEANLKALLQENESLYTRIQNWLNQMLARLRGYLDAIAGNNAEVRAMKDDIAYMSKVTAMMQEALEDAMKSRQAAKKGESTIIKDDADVKEYREGMRSATNQEERKAALNGLMTSAFARTQREWLVNHLNTTNAEIRDAIEQFTDALAAYGRGEKWVEKALSDAGFTSPAKGSREMALLSFAGHQAAQTQEMGGKAEKTGKVNEKFSLKAPVEEKKTLMAIHNMTADKLKKAMELGGFPMPSIAIAKAEIGHQNFGPISLVFGRDTIDPKKNKKNVGYTADAWTPTFPQIEYQTESKKERELKEWARGLDIPEYYGRELNRAMNGLEDQANKRGGLEGLADYLAENKGMQAAYLAEQGTPVEIVKTEKEKSAGFPEGMKERLQQVIDLFNGDMDYAMQTPMNQIWGEYGEQLAAIFHSLQGHKERLPKILQYAKALDEYKGPEYEMVDDYGATEKKMRESIDETAFREWIYDKIDGFISGSGIYNNKEIYTASGNRRSFEQTHYPVTLENIVKAMAGQKKGGTKNIAGFHGVKSLRASTAETFKSIDEMHEWESRLQARTEKEANALTDELSGKMYNLMGRILKVKKNRSSYENTFIENDTIGEILLELSDGKYTMGSIKNGLNQYGYAVDDALAEEIKALFDEIKHMPTNIFEAKPERVVAFDEVKAAIIPDDTDQAIKDGIAGYGIPLLEYENGDEKQRLELLNGLDDAKFSIKEENTLPAEDGLEEDAELYVQVRESEEAKAALAILRKLYNVATQGDTYLAKGENDALLEKGAWKKRMPEMMEKIKQETGSKISDAKMRKMLSELFTAMDNGENVNDMLMAARDMAKDILIEAPGMTNPIDPGVTEAMRILKERQFYLTDEMKSEIRETQYGSVAAYMRKNFGKMAIRVKAKAGNRGARVSLAEVWQELSEILPGTFAADAVEADMPGIVDAWLETAGQRDFGGEYGQNIGDYSTDLGLSMMLEYFDLPGALEKEKALRMEFEKSLLDMRTAERVKYEEKTKTRLQKQELQKARESAIKKISGDVKYLNTRIIHESNSRHVPEGLKDAVIKAIQPFLQHTGVFDRKTMDQLRTEYEALSETGTNANTAAARSYDKDIENDIIRMAKTMEGRRVTQLTSEELQIIEEVMSNLKRMVDNQNEMLINGRKENADKVGEAEITRLKNSKVKSNAATRATLKNTTPIFFFKRLGGIWEEMWNGFRKDESKCGMLLKNAKEYQVEQAEKYGMATWLNSGENMRFVSAQGEQLELTRQLALTLYATWQRETRNMAQGANHLRVGGFRYPDMKKAYEGVDMARPHVLTQRDMMQIESYLGKDAMAYADAMVRYLSEDMAALGNEVTMDLYGYNKFTEQYYFPYKSSREYLDSDITRGANDVAGEAALKSWGAAKKLTQKANKPIEVGDFTAMWATHVQQMCTYACFTVDADNLNRLLNYRKKADVRTANGEQIEVNAPAESMKQEFDRVYGKESMRYISTLMMDIAGGISTKDRTTMGKMISKFKKNAVAANLQVAIQQPSAIARAALVMHPKYFAIPSTHLKTDIAEMRQYSGIANIKDMGRFDTGTGRGTQEWLVDNIKAGSMWNRATGWIDDKTGALAEKADRMTWGLLWHAVKREVDDNNTNLVQGSEEYYAAVRDRFEEIVAYTQVYDSVFAKSELMRSNTWYDKMTTSFMAEPTLTANMLTDAILNVREMGGTKKLIRAVSTWVFATALNAMLKSFVSALRDDDEERTYVEKYIAQLWGNFTGDLNPMGLLPIVRDIQSLLDGYDVDRADMEIWADVIKTWEMLWDENKHWKDIVVEAVGVAGSLTGIPTENIWRDLNALLTTFSQHPEGGTDWQLIKYSMLDETPTILGVFVPWDSKRKAYYERIAEAMRDGNSGAESELRAYLEKKEGVSEKTVSSGAKTAIREMLMSNRMTRADAEGLLMSHYDMDKNKAYYQVEEWIARAENPEIESWSKYGYLYDALESGQGLQAAVADLKEHGADKSTIGSAITSKYKEEYVALVKAGKVSEANTMKTKILNGYVAAGYNRADKIKDIDAWLGNKKQ